MLAQVKAGIRGTINVLWSCPDILTEVTVSRETGRSFNGSAGRNVATYEDVSVKGILVEKARDRLNQENVVIQHESVDLLLRSSDLQNGLQLRDKVAFNGQSRQIKALQDYLGIAWGVTLEGG